MLSYREKRSESIHCFTRHLGKENFFLCLSDKLNQFFLTFQPRTWILCCHLSGTNKDSKHSTDSSNNSVIQTHKLSRTRTRTAVFPPWLANCRSVLSRASRPRQGTVGAKVQLDTHPRTPTQPLFVFTISSPTASFSVEKEKKSLPFAAPGVFPPLFHAFYLHVTNGLSHPRVGSVTRQRAAIAPLARANVEFTGVSQREQPSLSPGTARLGSAPGCFSLLCSCFLRFLRVCRRRKTNVRNKRRVWGGGS